MELARLFDDAGFQLFLVGGSVRDIMLGDRGEVDYDFATNARPDQIREVVGEWATDLYSAGEAFGTIAALKDEHRFEITTFRSEVYRDQSRKPIVEYSDEIETDLSRRDFTVNAIALRIPDPLMVDPYGGLEDLERRVLRTPLGPEISFGDDPLRMLRLFRFMSTLGFTPEQEALAAVTSMADRLSIVSSERIRDELSKLLVGDHVGPALEGLVDSGLAEEFLPEFPALAVEQDPVHRHKDVLAHTIAVVEKCPPQLELRLAALLHDIGKPVTRLIALRYPKKTIADVQQLVFLHMRPHTYKMGWTDRAVRRYVRDAGHLLEQLNTLVRCDVTTRSQKRARAIERRIDELEERIAQLREQEELDKLRPPIDGNDVMKHLGLEPGPKVGEAMRMLTEHRLDHGPYSEDEAYALLDEWAGGTTTG